MVIVCLGDSLTEGAGVLPEQCWVSLLQSGSRHRWLNAGISGDTSLGMLVRLQTQVLPAKPDMVIWLGGYNDILLTGSADQAKSCVMAFLNHCVKAGVKPVIGIPYLPHGVGRPWNKLCDWEACVPVLEEYIQWLRKLAKAALLRYVDFAPAGTLLQSDGMHPTAQGHVAMAEAAAASGYFKEAPL